MPCWVVPLSAADSDKFLAQPRKGGAYINYIFNIYHQRVVEIGLPNFMGANIPVPTNLNIGTWSKLAATLEDELVISFPPYGFPVRYTRDLLQLLPLLQQTTPHLMLTPGI